MRMTESHRACGARVEATLSGSVERGVELRSKEKMKYNKGTTKGGRLTET